MSDIRYADIVDELWAETQGAQQKQVERAIRDSVKDACDSLNFLWQLSEFDYESKDSTYTILHPEWDFSTLVAVYIDKALAAYQVDDTNYTNLIIGEDKTTFQMPYLTRADKVIARWSYRPKVTSDTFPYLAWSQFRDVIKYGALKRLGTYLRPMGKTIPNYHAMWTEEVFAAKRRLDPLPGPQEVKPFMGGENDWYGTSGSDEWS